jgi:hypothetical protein
VRRGSRPSRRSPPALAPPHVKRPQELGTLIVEPEGAHSLAERRLVLQLKDFPEALPQGLALAADVHVDRTSSTAPLLAHDVIDVVLPTAGIPAHSALTYA